MRKLYSSVFAIEGNPNCQISAKIRGRGDDCGGGMSRKKGCSGWGRGGGGRKDWGSIEREGQERKCMLRKVQQSDEGRWTGKGAGGSFKGGERQEKVLRE